MHSELDMVAEDLNEEDFDEHSEGQDSEERLASSESEESSCFEKSAYVNTGRRIVSVLH